MAYKILGKLALALLLITHTAITLAAENTRSPLGINSNEVMDDDASVPFVDVFRASVPFEEARPWLTKGKVKYDANGWPVYIEKNGQVGTRFINKLPAGTVPDGLYTVLYEGKGKLIYGNDAKLVHHTPGKDIVAITAGKDKELRGTLIIKETDPQDHIRNIRILMPGGICMNNPNKRVHSEKSCPRGRYLSFEKHYASIIFNPDYLNYMNDFKVIRFMNMAGITRNPITHWNERNTMSQQTWGGKPTVRGAPLEIMVELANQTGSDPWFCLPHKASDDYIRKFSSYVRDHLRPGLKVYVEYTNEAWNTIFTQAHYMKDQGEELGLDGDRTKAGNKFYSMRSVQIFDIWEQTFGGTDRIIRVMGSWAGWTRTSEMLLSYRNAYKKTDAVAIAPYFFPAFKSAQKARSVAQLFKLMYDPKEKYSIPKVLGYIHKNAEMAKKFGVDLIAYEGGQHLVDWKSRNVKSHPTKLMIAANKDWRMAKAYTDFMRGWKDNGGKLFVNFSAPRTYQWFGSWGTKEYITQPISKAPKHRSLMQFARSNPCWWTACSSSHIARLKKPKYNPVGDVFALVKSKPRKNKPKKAVIAQNKRSTIGTKIPDTDTKTNKTTSLVKVVSNKKPSKPISKAIISNNSHKNKTPIWETQTVNNNKRTDAQTTNITTNNAPHNAVTHRVRGRGRFWSNKSSIRLANIIDGKIKNGKDLSAVWQSKWDEEFLYVRIDTVDDKFIRDSEMPWSDDSIEIFVDADGSRGSKYDGKNDFHFIYRWKDKGVSLSRNSPQKRNLKIQQTMTLNNNGYSLETAIPWKTLGVTPIAGKTIGIDIQINDDDNGNDRDGKLAWYSKNNNAWTNPKNFGRVKLGI